MVQKCTSFGPYIVVEVELNMRVSLLQHSKIRVYVGVVLEAEAMAFVISTPWFRVSMYERHP